MLDHLSHAFHTFPLFGLVGMKDRGIRPVAVQDVVRILVATLVDGMLPNQTVAVLGPEELSLKAAVSRVAEAVGRKPLMIPLPLAFHYWLACVLERVMTIPLVSAAQIRILSEGITEPWGKVDELPIELLPATPFDRANISQGLPAPKAFGCTDLRIFGNQFHGRPSA
jgi:NADH dehydrogenase